MTDDFLNTYKKHLSGLKKSKEEKQKNVNENDKTATPTYSSVGPVLSKQELKARLAERPKTNVNDYLANQLNKGVSLGSSLIKSYNTGGFGNASYSANVPTQIQGLSGMPLPENMVYGGNEKGVITRKEAVETGPRRRPFTNLTVPSTPFPTDSASSVPVGITAPTKTDAGSSIPSTSRFPISTDEMRHLTGYDMPPSPTYGFMPSGAGVSWLYERGFL